MKHFQTLQEIKDEVTKLINERLALIDVDQSCYAVKDAGNEERPKLSVSYKDWVILTVMPFISNSVVNGNRVVTGMFSIRALYDDYWYDNEDLNHDVFVDEFLRCQFGNESTTFDQLLDVLLPLKNDEKVRIICEELEKIGLKDVLVKFDTFTYRYNVECDIHSFLETGEDKTERKKKRYLKYMSFNTFLEIAKSGKLRLNSIMSMNDSSESFYLGDNLCNAYDDERRKVLGHDSRDFFEDGMKNSKVVEYKNYLVGCFSDKVDDALMWRLYGDSGRGVCLEFEITNDSLKPVMYLDERDKKALKLAEVANGLKKQGIRLFYKDIANYQFYTKSHYYRDEGEWRILQYVKDDELAVANYGGLISFYKDFSFEELGLKPVKLYLGANLSYKDVNVPLLVDLSRRCLKVKHVQNSLVDSLRV